jgi:hypothetical protein
MPLARVRDWMFGIFKKRETENILLTGWVGPELTARFCRICEIEHTTRVRNFGLRRASADGPSYARAT